MAGPMRPPTLRLRLGTLALLAATLACWQAEARAQHGDSTLEFRSPQVEAPVNPLRHPQSPTQSRHATPPMPAKAPTHPAGPMMPANVGHVPDGGCVGPGCACDGPGCGDTIGPGFGPVGFGPQAAPLGPSPWEHGPSERHWLLRQLDLRHSSTHGRAMGPGEPLRGTSWLNRPYWVGFDGGLLAMPGRPATGVDPNNDLLGALSLGWDWDPYWGAQLRVAWSTPEFRTDVTTTDPGDGTTAPVTTTTTFATDDNLLITDLSAVYYPWGDSRLRPYWRIGVGLTDLEYTNLDGNLQHDMLFTIPLAGGMKYQLRRWLAWRLEVSNNIAIGKNDTSTMNNISVTAGLEWRFGGRSDGYWAWAPRGGSW